MLQSIRVEHRGTHLSRLRKFSVRTLLLAFTCVAIAFGVLAYKLQEARQQALALTKIEALGGIPMRVDDRGYNFKGKQPPPKFVWLHQLLGDQYFVYVPYIDLKNSSVTADRIREMIPLIKQIRLVEGMNEVGKSEIALDFTGNQNVDEELIAQVRRQLPQCVILSAAITRNEAYHQ
ncbi:MAG TPA: hypothetical protein VGM76_12360 [Lacipirellulaceae bacterium]|jgi:hypothetical protein